MTWEELIVTQKKLEIAVKALEEIVDASDNYRFCQSVGYKNIANEALKQIKELDK